MKIYLEIEAISEEERVETGKTSDELSKSGFMLLPMQQVWVPMQLWNPTATYRVIDD